jgi:peroxiredoxin Q/BCP
MGKYSLNPGDTASDITLPVWPEGELKLSDLRGQWVILYFYPRDNTPGCTTEACEFRDAQTDFSGLDAIIVGVSRDSLASHQRFAEKQALPFQLISDADELLCKAFDVIRMKNMYGKQVRGIERSTFIISSEGVIAHAWRKVRVKGHVEDVLNTLEKLQA